MKELTIPQIITFFKNKEIPLATAANEYQLNQLENELDFIFPDDFKSFHQLCGGFADLYMDENHISVWPLDRILEEYNEEKEQDPDFIPIADFLINSHWYGYVRNELGVFKEYDQVNKIADTFKELLNLIIIDSNRLY